MAHSRRRKPQLYEATVGEPAIAGRFVVSDPLAQRSNQVRQLTFVPLPAIPQNKAILLRPCEDLPKAAAIAGFVRETHRSLERQTGGLLRAFFAAGGRDARASNLGASAWLAHESAEAAAQVHNVNKRCVLASSVPWRTAREISFSLHDHQFCRGAACCTESAEQPCFDERQSSSRPRRSQEP